MKFGKDFKNHLEETLPGWRDKFLSYKPLKKLIKHLPPDHPSTATEDNTNANSIDADWFVKILNDELDKFNDFYFDKEEEFVIRLKDLKERIERVRENKNGDLTSEREFSEEMLEIRKAFVTIHGEMVLLKNYSSLNFAGLVKILKKYDKRTGGLLSLPFAQRARQEPFFTTELLTGLLRDCEANLELLFPLEAEVVESGTTATKDDCDENNDTGVSSAKQDTDEVYRSTLAAIKAIENLRKASSTYSHLSFSRLFHKQDDDDDASGAVTTENSASDSPQALQQNKEGDQESVHSGE